MTHKPIPHSTVSRLERADAVVSQVVMFTKWGHRLVTKMSFSKATVGYSIKTKYCLEELAVSGCLGWPEFSSSIFNALFNEIQEVH